MRNLYKHLLKIFFYSTTIIILMNCSCLKCENTEGRMDKDGSNDFSLKFNTNKKDQYQMIHVDLTHDFVLLAKPDSNINDKSKIRLLARLAEIKNCEKYSLVSAEYLRACPNEDQVITHHIKFRLKEIKKGKDQRVTELPIKKVFDFKKNENLDIHIFYNNEPDSIKTGMPDKNCKIYKPVIDERICKSVMITNN